MIFYDVYTGFNNHILQYSSQKQCPPGHSGTIFRDVLKTYVEKHAVTYASFCAQTNQICIIFITEVLPYLGKSTGTICVPTFVQVFPERLISRDIFPTIFL